MSLRREDIERQVFKEVWRGYDQDEVDRFLDRVAERIGSLQRERDQLADDLKRVESQASEALEAEQLLKRTLIAAQRTADETVSEAREQASELIADAERRAQEREAVAERRAEELVNDAQQRAEELLTNARYQAGRELAHARGEAVRVRRAVEDLRRLRAEYRDQVRAVIAEHLALLDRAGDVPDMPVELEKLAGLTPPDVAGATPAHGRGDESAIELRDDGAQASGDMYADSRGGEG